MELVTPDDLAERLHVPPRTLAQWRYLGTGPDYLKLGKHVRYREADIAAWLDEQAARGATRAAR